METQSDAIESEKISDNFLCCVCLDLLYKPVVLACGHVSCFWCIHMSMNGFHESHCPLCRHPYHHFPTICQILHLLLLKMYPVTYKRREKQTLEEEKKMGFFSPNFDDFGQAQSSLESNQENRLDDVSMDDVYVQHQGCRASSAADRVDNSLLQTSSSDISQRISIDDVLCVSCKQLLFQPVVLNCGHVYCENCLVPAEGSLKCQICQSPHPRGFPKVYLYLDHFIEERFKEEYAMRKIAVQVSQLKLQHENQANGSAEEGKDSIPFPGPTDKNFLNWCADNGSKVHFGIGCDYCGMFPILGERYRCKDCKEAVGFDLCGDCYNTQSKLPGRFNQQHTSDHEFESVKTSTLYNMILRVLRGPSENGTRVQDPGPENEWVIQLTDGSPLPDTEDGESNVPPWMVQEAVNAVMGPSGPGLTEDHQDDDDDTLMPMSED